MLQPGNDDKYILVPTHSLQKKHFPWHMSGSKQSFHLRILKVSCKAERVLEVVPSVPNTIGMICIAPWYISPIYHFESWYFCICCLLLSMQLLDTFLYL